YGYCKDHKKMVKTGKTRTREKKENTRARRMLSKVNQSQPLVNMVNTSQPLHDKTGNPCAYQNDPRAKNEDPMNGIHQGCGLRGASN
ncbi:hypothetical protein Tco_0198010, partial [Tanacetum coccineum]